MIEKSSSRMTKQRMVIMDELRKNCNHPTADELYASVRIRLPRISLGTVYRNLDIFAEAGEVLRLENAGSTRRFDAFTEPHQHIRCTACGCVADVASFATPESLHSVSVPGFTVTAARIDFEGICDSCLCARSKAS